MYSGGQIAIALGVGHQRRRVVDQVVSVLIGFGGWRITKPFGNRVSSSGTGRHRPVMGCISVIRIADDRRGSRTGGISIARRWRRYRRRRRRRWAGSSSNAARSKIFLISIALATATGRGHKSRQSCSQIRVGRFAKSRRRWSPILRNTGPVIAQPVAVIDSRGDSELLLIVAMPERRTTTSAHPSTQITLLKHQRKISISLITPNYTID